MIRHAERGLACVRPWAGCGAVGHEESVSTRRQSGRVARVEQLVGVFVGLLSWLVAQLVPFQSRSCGMRCAQEQRRQERRGEEACVRLDEGAEACAGSSTGSASQLASCASACPDVASGVGKAHEESAANRIIHTVESTAEQLYQSVEASAGQFRHSVEASAGQFRHSVEASAGQLRHSVETSVGHIRTTAAASADQVIHKVEEWAHLFADHKMPEWAQRPFITHGYRPIGQPIREIVMSAFQVHNETGNFWTHFVPGVIFLFAALPYVLFGCLSDEPVQDRIFMIVYVLAAASCHTASSVYHLFSCRNEHTFVALCRTDYKAIVSLICASQFPALSVVLLRRHNAWGIGAITGLAALWILGIPLMNIFEREKMDAQKNLLMVVMASFGSIMICLATFTFRAVELSRAEILFLTSRTLVMYSAYGLGFAVFGLRLPERWVPGKVNLVGHSHQVWHLCVTVGSSYWLYALLQFYDMGSRLAGSAATITI
ncbi:Adiponectin receptor protein [Porphyridium purpureum]|uniref:Adiponectin receptor protein n=1 Tax=Porphyridium purpureum TaxID=35688 RepID=A0A5J4YVU3_PORPP|nr:Adiponectin receptor protein [Porphyridium purpureum]|eukprot:POR7438..scf227_4